MAGGKLEGKARQKVCLCARGRETKKEKERATNAGKRETERKGK